MQRFIEVIRNIIKIEELRKRVVYTLFILLIVRIGAHIALPGVDSHLLKQAMDQQGGSDSLFGLYDLFVGGAFRNAAIFALGIMPYISASIILQLAGAVLPSIAKLQQEGEEGRKKINQWTRIGTVLIAGLTAWGTTFTLNKTAAGGGILAPGIDPYFWTIQSVLILTAGTIFMMWLGEQITDRGIGNGISLIIFIGIIDRLPYALGAEYQSVQAGGNLIVSLILLTLLVFIIAGVVLVTQGTRRIPVEYAKRVVGRKVYGGVTQYIPLRVNTAGVMPIIFAQAIMFIPNTLLSFFPDSEFIQSIAQHFNYTSFVYSFIYALVIIFFTYFYTAIAFNPKEVADNMKRQGGFIPGIRPGKQTSEFIDNILTKITLPGSIFLAIVAILPAFVSRFNVAPTFAQFFGGTSLLIVVGVALDTMIQINSMMVMRHYDGFMKGGKLTRRRSY
ncbi:MAG: preprotein translocase subunit SecY [Ignavibacteriales bacterium]|nr:MAG: preprotein translocase subunit SecY [Ignavibacteriaceae bacterium]MBW7873077.1 preprotein translocase subunit SecY [Ignavibacteria bacterium]MCZ2142720.1 preprotein translocase subunit SecY [Ignavibacteriales bacterium]OQY77158.1 MAG: preprotein translocase subunit SecY [Ignavibacteriales bacterium UTCHB3]MBV6443816.1 Protein translocase subunit SecY [Ignavibacteriaceae bacterium]